MKITKSQRSNIFFLVVIALLIIPQTRKPIQIVLHSVLSKFSPSIINEDKQETVSFKDWDLVDLEGNLINFKELEGEVIFLNFWATWCPPCIAELPALSELYADYNDKITFVLVSNEEQDVVKDFFEKKDYDLNAYSPRSQYPDDFDTRSIPRTYLIDKKGNIIIDKGGAANWNSDKVRQLLDTIIKE